MFNRDYKTTISDHGTTRPQMKDDETTRPQDNRTEACGHGHFVTKALRERNGPWSVVRGPWSFRQGGFTLAELLVTMGVLVVLVLLFTQLLNSAATTMTLGSKRMDADSQARQLLDRMTLDFDQMLKRTDVDYFAKRTAPPNSIGGAMNGNDQIAFFSAVPGYGSSSSNQSPLSLVSYRVNNSLGSASYNKVERLGKGLVWNPVSTDSSLAPIVFLPLTISAMWPYATNQDLDAAYEVIGPDVFRFEYYYLLKAPSTTQPAIFSDTPWDVRIPPGHASVSGMRDVAAIVVAIAVIDPKTKGLLATVDPTGAKLARLNGADGQGGPVLIEWGNTICAGCPTVTDWQTKAGLLTTQWRAALDANTIGLPRPAISGIRLYERYFSLSQ
jgi:type II secretory pathway pseudopilin PulG